MSTKNEKTIDTHQVTPDPDEPTPKAANAVRRTPEEVERLHTKIEPRKVGENGPMTVGVNMDHTN